MRRFTILLLVLLLLTVPVSGQFKPPSSIDVQANPSARMQRHFDQTILVAENLEELFINALADESCLLEWLEPGSKEVLVAICVFVYAPEDLLILYVTADGSRVDSAQMLITRNGWLLQSSLTIGDLDDFGHWRVLQGAGKYEVHVGMAADGRADTLSAVFTIEEKT